MLRPRELLQEFTIALRNAYHEPFTAWTQGELDEMVRRKKDKDSRPTYKTIASFLQKSTEEVKHAWKGYQRLEAQNWLQPSRMMTAAAKIMLMFVLCLLVDAFLALLSMQS